MADGEDVGGDAARLVLEGTPEPSPSPPLAYVLKVFPRVSETFVINEIRALERLGERLCIHSLHHGDAVPHGILRSLRSPVVYVEDEPPAEDEVGRTRRRLRREMAIEEGQEDLLLPRKYVRLALRLAATLRTDGSPHLHAHFASRAGHVAGLAARLAGCTYSITAHAKDIYHRDVDPAVLRWKIAGARFVVTVSDHNRAYLRDLVADLPGASAKIVRLYNGVDLERFRPTPAPAEAAPMILGVGRLVEKKGFAVLVDACRRLRDAGRTFRCEIVGAGPEEEALRRQIEEARLTGVVSLTGVLPTERVADALRRAAVVALPCVVGGDGNVDALPTVLLEAAASGRAAVSTRLSGIPEIVEDGATGLLVPPADAAALAAALEALIRDPRRAQCMGRAARSRAEERFDLLGNAARLRRWLRGGDWTVEG